MAGLDQAFIGSQVVGRAGVVEATERAWLGARLLVEAP
jgi:hypothetical protein